MNVSVPLVSIIVPCYNQAHFLNECLQSVLEQTFKNWSCIIVNDGSPDDTEQVAHEWCARDERFSYIFQENKGLSAARNTGIAATQSTYILPLDADDVIHKNFLAQTIKKLESMPDVGIVSVYSKFFINTIDNVVDVHQPKGKDVKYLLYVNQLVATSLYRRICWEQVGGYDESMRDGFEDWEFWLHVTKKGWNYAVVPKELFYYRKKESSMLTTTIKTTAEQVRYYIMKKHKELYIEDFENCITVLFHYITTSRKKEQRLQQSIEYKLGSIITKPFKMLGFFK